MILPALIALATASPQTAARCIPDAGPVSAESREKAVRGFFNAMNDGRIEAASAHVTADAEIARIGGETIPMTKEFEREAQRASPGTRAEFVGHLAAGPQLVVKFRGEGFEGLFMFTLDGNCIERMTVLGGEI